MPKKYRKGVFVVAYKIENNKIFYLLLKRKLHWRGWEFPKGGVEKKELALSTVKREIREETGQFPVKIKYYKTSGEYQYKKEFSDRKGYIGQTYKLFSAELKNRKIIIDKKEHSVYKWLEYKKAVSLLKWPNQKRCLTIANKKLIRKV